MPSECKINVAGLTLVGLVLVSFAAPCAAGPVNLTSLETSFGSQHLSLESSISAQETLDERTEEIAREHDADIPISLSEKSISMNASSGMLTDAGENVVPQNKTVNVSSVTDSKELPVQNCSESLGYEPSLLNLKCPNVEALNNSLRKHKTVAVEVEIEWVGGALQFPNSNGVQVNKLKISNANLTSIANISLQMLQNLKILDLSQNPDFNATSMLQLGTLPSLTNLYLRGSALTSLESQLRQLLKNLPKLEHLDIAYSGIGYIRPSTFDENKVLKHLDIAGNELNDVTLSEDVVSRLKHLNMSACRLRDIKVQGISAIDKRRRLSRNLEVLDVSKNYLKGLRIHLLSAFVPECIHLNIEDNALKEACSKCSLYHLWKYIEDFSNTSRECSQLKGLKEVSCFREDAALQDCGWDMCPDGCRCDSKDNIVECGDSGLPLIPWVAPSSAEVLRLSTNHLKNLSGIESVVWCNLRVLQADNNNITSLLSKETRSRCDCQTNRDYYRVNESCFPMNLRTISLRNNSLQRIAAKDCPLLYSVHKLILSNNNVSDAGARSCGSLDNLEILDMSHNNIGNVSEPEFASYPHLRQLFLSDNKLRNIQPDVTSLILNLEVLDLSHNQLINISGHFSAPRTGFFTKKSGKLQKLFLNHNQLSQVGHFLALTEITSLEEVRLDNNLWSCECNDLKKFKTVIFDYFNTALYSALKDMSCTTPREKAGWKLSKTLQEKDCPDLNFPAKTELFMTLMACVIIFLICIFICYSNCWSKIRRRVQRKLGKRTPGRPRKKFDLFVACSSRDLELVRQNVIIPLTQRGYSIAWHENAFRPGDWIRENIERAIRNSSRMLVFASENFVNSRWGNEEINRGRHEEFVESEFKIMSLVTMTLPKDLKRPLYEIVALRTHVLLSDRDYIQQICNFLPTPVPVDNNSQSLYVTETDIESLIRKVRDLGAKHNQHSSVGVTQLFHTSHESSQVTVSLDVAPISPVIASDGNEAYNKAKEEYNQMVERFKVTPVCAAPDQGSTDVMSNNEYSLIEQDNEVEEVVDPDPEYFVRGSYNTISCRSCPPSSKL